MNMVCLGPRKKEKKAAFLSPEETPVSRTLTDPLRNSKRGSKLKSAKTSPTPTAGTIASRRTTPSPRSSFETASLSKQGKTTPRNSFANRANSPVSRPTSPHPSRPTSIAASVRSTTKLTTHSRNASAASTRKSPIAQMREEFDELKIKNDENLQLIAQQKAELEQLKLQLAQQPTVVEAGPTPPISQSTTYTDFSDLQEEKEHLLQEKEEKLREQEKELENLRKRLENVPSITVQTDEEGRRQSLEEKERMLLEKERELEEQRKELETVKGKGPALEEVAAQLEQLKSQNEEAMNQLASKENELEVLRSKIQSGAEGPDIDGSLSLQKINDLNQQLEAQKKATEEMLRRHEEALAEKDRLLKEQQDALEQLQDTHTEEMRKLKTSQTSSILTLKQRHKRDMDELQQRLSETEKKMQNEPGVRLDDEIERILHEFEQAEHDHTVQIENLQQSHENELSDLQENHVAQISQLKKAQDQKRQGWTSRYLPTEAVSWPAPQPLSRLRKTQTATQPKKALKMTDEYAPILIPLDNKKVQVYFSSVSGNPVTKKNQEHIKQLLNSRQINYDMIDVAASEAALQYMRKCNGSEDGIKEVPQIFVGGEYRGQYEDFVRHVDDEKLIDFLRPAAERVLTEEEKAAIEKSKAAMSDEMAPVRVLPAGPVVLPTLRKTSPGPVKPLRDDDDEALLQALEEELSQGKVNDTDLASL
ncbi:SH3-binding, glutamic acid-rich protein-domain-containing protein [Radiomyces spectabilis]|uniref:SH3-binding, glutamic acid-rich protein-domain-containing protein n=1 Tax=Radiomyces spectabilis TaxID=64574 RepID=UPI00221F2E4D|nr:SH3-binding, glutamic acid-rich protein-domain-containing protein [Radiomyces spectabilis]KAI8390809.1 SH3-binding, glutamic acid-rich protein-domain-containing protein [Radiomyces spectabilis]